MTFERSPADVLPVTPIGALRTPFPDRASAPRQPAASRDTPGRIELYADGRFEHALEDLDRFRRIWVLFWFHLNDGWKAKVRPPRSEERRGVFATRSPYRPNPIGMSVLRLERIEGLTLHVLDVDMVDGTPVVDLKPYLPYTDAFPDAAHGWLDADGESGGSAPRDPRPAHTVVLSPEAQAQLAFLRERYSVDLSARITEALSLGPSPHPYRRIKAQADGFVLAVKDYRVHFRVDGLVVTVHGVRTGYRPSQLFGGDAPELSPHRGLVEAFGLDGDRSPEGRR